MCLALACLATPAAAQTPPSPRLPRGDVSLTLGWLHSNVSALTSGDDVLALSYDEDWASRRATLTGQVGFYWTEHVKTEFTAERSSSQEVWQGESILLGGGRQTWRNIQHDIQDTRFSVGQFYQFGHNAWAHALLGGGVSVTARDIATEISPVFIYDSRETVLVQPGETRRSDDVRTNAFVAAAVKGYVTPRWFIRGDTQVDFRSKVDAVVLRIGFGVDF